MATPSIKQRISKIDVGEGTNHVEDYLSCISSAANYFTVGGSYTGAVIVSILNLALHTEQWSRWNKTLSGTYFLPVELGGFPIIEPFSTCISGAVANLYLRAERFISTEKYAKLFSSIITEKPEEFTLSDYYRVPKSISDISTKIKIFKNSGALGLHSLIRTDKKLSQFEYRHKMSQWKFPDHFLTLKHSSSDPRFFLYNIYKNGCMSLFSESLGVNSFYKRFTDPWLSRERKCFKVSKKSLLVSLGLTSGINYSYNDVEKALSKVTYDNAANVLESFIETDDTSEFTKNLIEQLVPRLDDAHEILNFICSQECSDYIEP